MKGQSTQLTPQADSSIPPHHLHTEGLAMHVHTARRLAAVSMVAASVLAIAGFTALGAVFDYPTILEAPTDEILASFRQHEGVVTSWFLGLVVSAALLAPIGVLLGRVVGGRPGRWITGTGVAAATVQAVGLSRWILFVPSISDDAQVASRAAEAHDTFEVLHTWLGTVLGETIGYALTSVFTVLVTKHVVRNLGPRWMTLAGYAAAALIATGVLVPLGLELAGLSNFAGYVLWCLWLVSVAVILWRTQPSAAPSPTAGPRTAATT